MRRLILALGVLAILATGCAPTPDVEVMSAIPAVEVVSVDSESEPSGIRGLTVGELLRDAWTSDVYTPNPDAVVVPEYVATFDGTPPATFDATHYRVTSHTLPGVVHVFRMVYVHHA